MLLCTVCGLSNTVIVSHSISNHAQAADLSGLKAHIMTKCSLLNKQTTLCIIMTH